MAEQAKDQAAPEVNQAREQFRMLISHRVLIIAGVLAGLLGGLAVALSSEPAYTATAQVTLRTPTTDPFAGSAGATAQAKLLEMGSERELASGNRVAAAVLKRLGLPEPVGRLQQGLSVSSPPNTLVLRFTYNADDPVKAADRANAFAETYLATKRQQTQTMLKTMLQAYREQLKEVQASEPGPGEEGSRVNRIVSLGDRIAELEAVDPSPGFVIGTATPPEAPTGLGLRRWLAIGGMAGVALGLLAAWLRMTFDSRTRTASDVGRALGAPVLTTLPPPGRGSVALSTGKAAEDYRSVAFRLAHDDRLTQPCRLLITTARGPDELSAAAALNLAAHFSELGRKVLLVESDLRQPRLAELVQSSGLVSPTAAEFAPHGGVGWPAAALAIDAGDSGEFTLIPGVQVDRVSQALTSEAADWLFRQAVESDTVVIVYVPAMLSWADAIALIDRVDGVIVPCLQHADRRADLERVSEIVHGAGGTVVGALVHRGVSPLGRLLRRNR